MSVRWLTAFLDFPAPVYDAGVAFWRAVTGFGLSAARGSAGEFATLLPPEGDAHLRVQRVGSGEPRVHLDVHRVGQPFEVHRSPGGLAFCLVGEPGERRTAPADWGTHASAVDQVCLDIPSSRYDAECAFWADLTGWPVGEVDRPEFRRLADPPGASMRVLLQRLDESDGPVRAHLDLATSDRGLETARHQSLGALVQRVHDQWTVLTDPTGLAYCITDRAPR